MQIEKLRRLPAIFALAAAATLAASARAQGPVQVGSHLGGGSVGVHVGPTAPPTTVAEEKGIASALGRLDSASNNPAVWKAISAQTRVPESALRQQQAATKLNPGELLIANTLAARSGQGFNQIVAEHAQTRSWGTLARKLGVDPAWLASRVKAADDTLGNAKARPWVKAKRRR